MNGTRPGVSVIIPHLNQHESLVRCLSSLAEQDYPADLLEIIVVDNGSSAPCDVIVSQFASARTLHEPAPGPGLARNTGVAAAKHELLAFIDADCRADGGWVSAAVAALYAKDSTGVVGGDVRIDTISPPRLSAIEAYECVFAYRQQLYITRDGYSGTGNLAMRRSVHQQVGPFAGIGIAEDYDWGRRARAAGYPARYAEDMIVYHPARTTMTELQAKWRRHIAHDLSAAREQGRPDALLAAKSFALIASIVPHAAKLALSPRVSGFANKLRGIGALISIRLFRCAETLRQIRSKQGNLAEGWNR